MINQNKEETKKVKMPKRAKKMMESYKAGLVIRRIEEIVDSDIKPEYIGVLIKYEIDKWRNL